MKQYYKEENGKRVWFNGVLKADGKQIINPSEAQILAEGWLEYIPPVAPEPTEEELLEQAKDAKIQELHAYDESEEVNDCIIVYQGQELHYWANKDERNDLKNAIRDCIAMGRMEYRLDLRDLGVSITAECENLLLMMAALEVYAVDCFNKTTDHRYAILSQDTRDGVNMYEFRGVGYPEKLTFNF